MTDQPSSAAAAPTPVSGGHRLTGRSIVAALFWLLACLAILLASVAVWAHRTVLTDEGWGGIVAGVAADPEVIEATSQRLVDRVSESLDLEATVARVLPGDMKLIPAVITGIAKDRLAEGIANVAADERFQQAFVSVNEKAHAAAMKVIRGSGSDVITTDEGAISLNIFPLIGGALTGLQQDGIIPADIQVPDLASYEPDPDRVAKLETLLGRDLPDDIGTITLVRSDRLATVQDAVRMFDAITVLLVLVAIACVLVAIGLSARRLRMIAWLAVGSIVALLLGRLVTRLVIEDITGALRGSENGVTVMGVVDSTVDSLMWFTFAAIVVALAVAGVALLLERRTEVSAVVSQPGSLREWLRTRSRAIAYVGIGLVTFVVLWNVGGPDITLVAAALVGIVLIAVAVIGGRQPGAGERAPQAGPA
jgi:hypothetical protein